MDYVAIAKLLYSIIKDLLVIVLGEEKASEIAGIGQHFEDIYNAEY